MFREKRFFVIAEAILIWFMLLTACAGKGSNESITNGIDPEKIAKNQTEEVESASAQWNIKHKSLPHAFETAIQKDGKIVGCYYDGIGCGVSICDAETCEEQSHYNISDISEIKSICIGKDNELVIFGEYNEKSYVWKISQNGEIIKSAQFEVENLGTFPRVEEFLADINGFYYLWYWMTVPWEEANGEDTEGRSGLSCYLDRIYVFNRDMECVGYEQLPDVGHKKIIALLFDEKEQPYLLARDEEGYYTQQVRTEKREEYEKHRIEGVELYEMETGKHCAMAKDGLLFIRDGSLHLFHLDNAKDERLLELAEAGIMEEDVVYIGMNGDSIEIIDNHVGIDHTEYTKITSGEKNERKTITLAVMRMTPLMKNMVANYNRNQNLVTIEPVIYAENTDYDTGFEKLQLDLIQGKAPDLITTDGLDVDLLAAAGAFWDLYTFMDSEAQYGRDAWVESVLKAYETSEKLYVMAPNFYLYSMWGGKSVVNGRSGIHLDDLMSILSENGNDINCIYGFSADESVIRTLCAIGMDEFIDWADGTCNLAGDEFQKVLHFAKEYSGKRFDSLYSAIREKEVLLVIGNLACVEDYSLWSEMFGEKVEFIGCPTGSGSGSVAYYGEGIAINSKTKVPLECWEFVKNYLLEGYSEGAGFPLLKSRLEKVLEESMQESYIQFEDGGVTKQVKKAYEEWRNEKARIYIYKASEADVETVRHLIESVSGKYAYHKEIMNIIDEEAESFFVGNKTVQQATEIIQNRVLLYLKENKN